MKRFGHVVKTPLGKFRHHVDLPDLTLVVEVEWFKVGIVKTSIFLGESYCHGRTKNRKPFVETNDLLLMQPQECTVTEFLRITAAEKQI